MKQEQINNQRIEDLISSSISKVKTLSDTNTIIGEQIKMLDGSIIIPISKVSVGFVSGGSEFNALSKKNDYPMGGASGGGVSVVPIGFIVQTPNEIKFVDITVKNSYDALLTLLTKTIEKVGIKNDEKIQDSSAD